MIIWGLLTTTQLRTKLSDMKIAVHFDNTLPLQPAAFTSCLDRLCSVVEFAPGTNRIRIPDSTIRIPETTEKLKPALGNTVLYDLCLVATTVPHENNYFLEGENGLVIISFSGWNLLTDLPVTNGLAYFVASMIVENLGVGESHDSNIGCVNCVWWDKRGVDLGMRSAYICRDCFATADTLDPINRAILDDAVNILNLVSQASRVHNDIVEIVPPKSTADHERFDVFLCHNSEDKDAVRALARQLREHGVTVWFDEDQLPPGIPWQPLLEKQIMHIKSAAVFVGNNGLGPWQHIELRAFLTEFAQRGCPVIPVILPNATAVPELPLFLRQMTWVDFRKAADVGIERMIWAITGKRSTAR